MDNLVRVTSIFMKPQEQQAHHLINEMDVDDNAYLKNVSSNRAQTDRHSLIVHITAITALVLLVGYCMAVGDVKRIINGYDHCGNVCGEKNYFQVDNPECHAQDMTDKPYLFLESVYERHCISDCSKKDGVVIFMNRCIKKSSMQIPGKDDDKYISQFARDIKIYLPEIIYSCFMSLGFSLIMIVALRFTSGVLVWGVLGLIVFALAALAAFFWQMSASEDINADSGTTGAAIFVSILTIVVITIILMIRRRIQLVIQLLKEAGKALASIPLLYIQPALTALSIIVLISIWSYFTLLIESAGDLVSINGIVEYNQSGLVRFTFWYNVFMLLWCCQFVYGCQQMITAGAISVWYFARNKSKLGRPIVYSTGNLLKFHMGTVSIGSLVISVVMMLRLLARAFRRYQALACFCRAYLSIIQTYIKYFTRNAYIITSIYGYGFHDAGSKAFDLLTKNALTVIAINFAGDFVLAFSKAIIVVASVGVGYALMEDKQGFDNKAVPLMIVGFVAFFIAHCFVTIYEMAVDTIFLCFCEDCEVNDGTTRPYYMSRDMMQFVQNVQILMTPKMGPNQPPVTVTVVN